MIEGNDENNDASLPTTRRVARQECELLEHQVDIPDFEEVLNTIY